MARAIENAELNGITNSAFFAGNVGLAIEELHERSGAPDLVVVDPPHAGLRRQGAPSTGAHRRAEDRLRVVQPDDARFGPEDAARAASATSSSAPSQSTCPAHAARRVRDLAGENRSDGRVVGTAMEAGVPLPTPDGRVAWAPASPPPVPSLLTPQPPEQVGVRDEEADREERERR